MKGGHDDCVRYFVEKGLEINSLLRGNTAAIHIAAENGSLSLIKCLKELGANMFAVNRQGRNALHVATQNGHMECVNYLIEIGLKANDTPMVSIEKKKDIFTPLHAACRGGNVEIVKKMVNENGDIFARGPNDETSLHYATINGSENCVRYLIEQRIDVHARTSNGFTAVHYASRDGQINLLKVLFECGGDLLAEVNEGSTYSKWTPIHFAASAYHEKVNCVKFLVENGVDVNLASKGDGATALQIAVRNGSLNLLRYLVEWGADFLKKQDDGKNTFQLAITVGDRRCLDFLKEKCNELKYVEL